MTARSTSSSWTRATISMTWSGSGCTQPLAETLPHFAAVHALSAAVGAARWRLRSPRRLIVRPALRLRHARMGRVRELGNPRGVNTSGQKELAVPGDHRAAAVVLPGDDANVGDAAPELEDLGARSRRQWTRRAQVIDAERDRFRHALAAAVVEEVQQRRELEEGAENAAMHGGEGRGADDLVPERQEALRGAA